MTRFWNVAILAALMSGCVLLNRFVAPEPGDDSTIASRSMDASSGELRIGGGEALAAGLAIQDLVRFQAAAAEGAGRLAPDGGVLPADPDAGWTQRKVDATRCYMTPSNYEARVELDAGARRWRVLIVPEGDCTQNMFGGGGVYEIDADSFEILHREYSE